ncbi:unnamed protein product, partial [Didymodactylos carnosus]
MTALNYIDFTKIHGKSQNQWTKELLIFDLLQRFKKSEKEKLDFDKTRIEVEIHEKFQADKSDILLKLLHRAQCNNAFSFNQCYDALKVLSEIDFENAVKILSNSKNPYLDLQKVHLRNLIYQRLLNKEINSEYIDSLASDMFSKFGTSVSNRLLCSIQNIDSLTDFEELLNFADKNKIKISDIHIQNASISALQRSLEITFLCNQIVKADSSKLSVSLGDLLDKKWTFEQLNIMFSKLEASNSQEKIIKEPHFIEVLKILSQYEIRPTDKNTKKILLALKKPAENWQREVNTIAVENNFTKVGKIKNAAQLIQELEKHNSHNQDITRLTEKILRNLVEIRRSDIVSRVLQTTVQSDYDPNEKKQPIYITEWTKDQIRAWANKVKTCTIPYIKTEDFLIEALAVIKQANRLDSEHDLNEHHLNKHHLNGYHLNDTQILSCLILLNANCDKGRLLQVGTGEGKSTIISVLAVIHALKGKHVDIITSSPVLAERDAKAKAKFYSMFDFQCDDNNDKSIYFAGPKTCYKKQIVYGEAAQFQFDTLRTEYAQLNTLGGRTCEVAIVDEVDSILIDDSSKIARLTTTISGMDQLQIIYHFLWHELVSLQDKLIPFNDQMYLFYGKLSFEQKTIILEYINEEGEIVKIPNLESYIASTSDISHIGQSIPKDVQLDAFIKNHLKNYIRASIKGKIKVPKNFAEFVHTQIPKWVDNAVIASSYQENVDYIVHEGLIKPVDYHSTGIVHSSTSWSDGLHQFLQIKHNLKMTSEAFTTNFLSNRGYFTKYGVNLFGLTGTLGSEKAKQLLASVYNVDLVIIPSLREKQYISLSDIVATNETNWLNEIYHSATNEASKGRGTLIICETIEHSIATAEKLRRGYRSSAVKLYTMNNMNQEKNIETVKPGEIIIATNLAGRGTDIKTHEIEKYGGLHVIITFMPRNQRYEDQGLGRTSRQGSRGTGQRILNAADLNRFELFDINNLQKITNLRDRSETQMLQNFQEHELKVITLKDKLFVKFCSLLNEIRKKIREKNGLFTKGKNAVKSVVTPVTPSVIESNVLLSIEEQWAMFLSKIDNQIFPIDIEQVHKEYNEFSRKINEDYNNDRVIKNPYYHTVIANDLAINDSLLKNNYEKAMQHFDRAIEIDPDNSAAAFAGKGWLLLKVKKRLALSNRRELGYKEKAMEALIRAFEILSEEMRALTDLQIFLQIKCPNTTTALSKQLADKVYILASYMNSLENEVIAIKKSQRLIQITEIEEYSDSREEHTDIDEDFRKERLQNCTSGVLKRIISYNGVEKGSGKPCDIRLTFHADVKVYDAAIKNCEAIVVVKENEDQFSVTYKQKTDDQLTKWMVDNQELTERLLSLPHNETTLDWNAYSEIYTLIYEKIKSNNGYIRRDFSTLLPELKDGSVYEVAFNDLTVRQDCGARDQAIETINQAVSETGGMGLLLDAATKRLWRKNEVLNKDYQHISISTPPIEAERLKTFLNPNIEIKEVTKEIALAQLKDKCSFFHRHLLVESLSPDSYKVNLEILDNNKSEMKSALLVRDAIEIIQNRTEDNLQFNLTFISANEISKVLQEKVLFYSNLTIKFIELNGEKVKEKLTKIVSKGITLEISGSKEKLLEVISSLKTEHVQLHSDGKEKQNSKSVVEIVDKTTAERKIKIANDSMTIKLIDMNKRTVEKVIDICPNANFSINFISIKFESLLDGLGDEMVSIHFDTLKKETAHTLIAQIRKENLDFSLAFKKLTNHQVKRLIKIAPIEQEHIEITKVKKISELFTNELRPNLELSEFSARGIEYLLEIGEKRFIPWRSIALVSALAAVQIAVGGALIVSGFGATVGMGLITEGIADLVIVAFACYTRKFSWSNYGIQKVVSLAISAVSMGISTLKGAGKGAQKIVTGTANEVLEQTGTQLLINSKDAGHVVIQTGHRLKSLALKQVGEKIATNSLLIINKAVCLSTPFVLKQLKPTVSLSIQSKVT